MSKEIEAKEFLHNLSLYDGNNDHFHSSHAVYPTSQLMEMYAKSKIEALTKENERLRERQDKCKHDFKEVHYVNDDYTPIGLFGVFCINCEKENKHI